MAGESITSNPAAANTVGSHVVDPTISQYAANPDQFTGAAREAVISKAQAEASRDQIQNGRYVLIDGEPRQGYEYPTAFSVNGGLRGSFDRVPADRDQWTRPMALLSHIEGRNTHVIFEIEGENGENDFVMIRRVTEDGEPPRMSADLQKFDMVSTKGVRNGLGRKEIESKILDGVVAVPGEPLVIGGKARGKVARIIGFNAQEKVLSDFYQKRILSRPEESCDVLDRFNEAMRRAKQEHAASAAGAAAMTGNVRP